MKKVTIVLGIVCLAMVSCKKNKCAECHYDKDGGEVEIGNYCGDEIENIEKSGYVDENGTLQTVYCGEH